MQQGWPVPHSSVVGLHLPSTAALIAVLALLVIAVPAAGTLFASRVRANADRPATKPARYARTMLVQWAMTGLAVYALALHGESAADVGVRPPTHAIAYFIGLAISIARIGLGVAGRNNGAASYARAIRSVIPLSKTEWLWFVPVVATAACCEEFLYRGYAFTQIAGLSGSITLGAIVSSAAFGLAHAYQGRIGMLASAITGLMYVALFAIGGGSLGPCVLAHFVQDIGSAAVLTARLRNAAPVGSANPPREGV
jgi:membrane protease YdiL (CAAX protease family)